jgi:23S rRNA pseudouridine2605 synthase
MQERLQKIIAAAGIASRRHAEEMIKSGLVSVNGETITELGTKADPAVDRIKVGNKLLKAPDRHLYILLHKPKGYVTTSSDPEGRPTVMDLIRNVGTRVYPVGRLDYSSEGLLLLTNDGELTQKLTHASSHVQKTYLVKVSGVPTEENLKRLRQGIVLQPVKPNSGEKRAPAKVRTASAKITVFKEGDNPWYEVTIIEGRNRQIRRMFEEIGHHVEKIKRVKYGPLQLDVESGKYRSLTDVEVSRLKQAIRPRRAAS